MSEILVHHKDSLIDISTTITISGYLQKNDKKTIDILLDWRLRLQYLDRKGIYPSEFIEKEILATDWILNKHNDGQDFKK